jgi:hypothetical protein
MLTLHGVPAKDKHLYVSVSWARTFKMFAWTFLTLCKHSMATVKYIWS